MAAVNRSVAGVCLSIFTQGFLESIVIHPVPKFSEDKDLHEWIKTADASIREFNDLNVVVDRKKLYKPPSELACQLCARLFQPGEQLLLLDEMSRYRFITTKVKNEKARLLLGEELSPYCQLEKERVQIDLLFYSKKIDENSMHRLLFDVHAHEAVLMKHHGWIPNNGAMPSSTTSQYFLPTSPLLQISHSVLTKTWQVETPQRKIRLALGSILSARLVRWRENWNVLNPLKCACISYIHSQHSSWDASYLSRLHQLPDFGLDFSLDLDTPSVDYENLSNHTDRVAAV